VAKPTKSKKKKKGRHVGLDFYDLLIEGLRTPERDACPTPTAANIKVIRIEMRFIGLLTL
jgi:hypothetical protein